jgi:hypothetical protein
VAAATERREGASFAPKEFKGIQNVEPKSEIPEFGNRLRGRGYQTQAAMQAGCTNLLPLLDNVTGYRNCLVQ